MRGHLRERSPGHWAIVIDMSDPHGKAEAEMAFLSGNQAPSTDRVCSADLRAAERHLS